MRKRVWFIMVLHPAKGWMRTGHPYGTRKDAVGWVPFVRGVWRGLRVRVTHCPLQWVNGKLDEKSRRTLDEKFNIDVPNAPADGRASRTVRPEVGQEVET